MINKNFWPRLNVKRGARGDKTLEREIPGVLVPYASKTKHWLFVCLTIEHTLSRVSQHKHVHPHVYVSV